MAFALTPQSHDCSLNYCWNVIADGVGQRRVSVVVPAVKPLARSVQHSPSVEE